jgi:hypothetical protein
MQGMGPGRESSKIIINSAYDNQIMISPNTPPAQNTFAEIPDHKRIRLIKTRIMRHRVKVIQTHAQLSGNLSQFASVSLVTNNARFWVIGHHEADYILSMLPYSGIVRLNSHVCGDGGDARGQNAPTVFVFHNAETTGSN